MEELTDGIRDLHARVKHLDDQLRERSSARDLHERLGAAAMETAERTRAGLRRIAIIVAIGLAVWTPLTAYGAVWLHEKIRNNCYPVAVWDASLPPHPAGEPWYCSTFPGTNHPHQHAP